MQIYFINIIRKREKFKFQIGFGIENNVCERVG